VAELEPWFVRRRDTPKKKSVFSPKYLNGMTTLWKGETLANTMLFSVLLYDPHMCHETLLKVTPINPTKQMKYEGSIVPTKMRGLICPKNIYIS
jgi:hypothetical protein